MGVEPVGLTAGPAPGDLSGVTVHAEEVLDFPRIRTLLAERARSPQGADRCRGLEPASEREVAERALDELDALAALEPVLGLPPVGGVTRIEPDLSAARREGACLEVERLLAVRDTLGACHRVLEYLEDAAAEGSSLGPYAGRMKPFYDLADRFERTFGARGEVLDGASPALQRLRAEIRRGRERILATLGNVLRDSEMGPAVQDDFVTLRTGRYVIPLRTDFRGYLNGIVHDRSRTGATFFVEPLEVVELNNRLGAIREEEEAEIRRILRELTAWVGREASGLEADLAVVAHLDALGARLVLAQSLRAVRPRLVPEPELHLRQARHPLLELQGGDPVVPVDLVLGADRRLLLVTGANAGGKTVGLKTAGLLTLMARSGLYVPAAEGSRVGWFGGVFADIGDEQDLDRHLSTFSAHVARVRSILGHATAGCLVLLDELGTGTDPREGVGLAMAVLESLLDRGAFVLGTTHLDGLKAFAYARADGENAAVAFEAATGRPLYYLHYGQAGASNALEVAEKLGIPADVLARARAYAAGGEAGSELIAGLERAREEARRSAEEAEAARRRWEESVSRQEALVAEARRERDTARSAAREEVREVLEAARRELAAAIARFARGEIRQQEAEAALRDRAAVLEEYVRPAVSAEPSGPPPDLESGARVHVASLGRDGVVEDVEADGARAFVRVGSVRVAVRRDEVGPAQEPGRRAGPPEPRPVRVRAEQGPPDVVVVGCTVEEALARVDKALDRALLAGVDGFRVVHGRGTGTLRRAVREHLAGTPQVLGVRGEGDGAATWVEVG